MKSVRDAFVGRSATLVDQYRGRRIKGLGDGEMMVFRAVEFALDYALALQTDTGEPSLKVRTGIHIGPVDVLADDIIGTAVNIAARVCAASEGDGIWLSNEAYADIDALKAERYKGLRWEKHVGVELKGLGPRTLWSLAQPGPDLRDFFGEVSQK
jgi:class 3 adenylate cyclase